MNLPRDWKEFLESLNSSGVEFVIVGAFAVAYHGRPRFTGDLDILVRPTPDNGRRTVNALREFGFGSVPIDVEDFLSPGMVIQLGVRPTRIDLVTALSGVDAEEVWRSRVAGVLDGVPVAFIDLDSLKRNKRATGRDQDLADLAALE
ncbi:MAG: hypothetical protein IPM24_19415 [Bryobacterales bacterium]|nr:hypothetical protein [Bryobacterales bacterium]